MAIRLSTNVSSLTVGRQLNQMNDSRFRSLEKISSGDRIVRSGDDAAGLSISENLKAGVRSLQMASRNSTDGISVVQTAEGGMNEVQNIMHRLRELAVQAASDTIGSQERSFVNQEFQSLKDEIQRIAGTTKYNGNFLLNGTGHTMEFQVGINADKVNDRLGFASADTNVTTAALGIAGAHLATKQAAGENLAVIDKATEKINLQRAGLGALQMALYSNVQNVNTSRENAAQANSRVRDADLAEWTATKLKQDIIAEAGTSTLSQANNLPNQALKLLER